MSARRPKDAVLVDGGDALSDETSIIAKMLNEAKNPRPDSHWQEFQRNRKRWKLVKVVLEKSEVEQKDGSKLSTEEHMARLNAEVAELALDPEVRKAADRVLPHTELRPQNEPGEAVTPSAPKPDKPAPKSQAQIRRDRLLTMELRLAVQLQIARSAIHQLVTHAPPQTAAPTNFLTNSPNVAAALYTRAPVTPATNTSTNTTTANNMTYVQPGSPGLHMRDISDVTLGDTAALTEKYQRDALNSHPDFSNSNLSAAQTRLSNLSEANLNEAENLASANEATTETQTKSPFDIPDPTQTPRLERDK